MQTRDDYEREAQETAHRVRLEQRMAFQGRRPHYTPPEIEDPYLRTLVWLHWRRANLELHGSEEACIERFGDLWPTSRTLAGL